MVCVVYSSVCVRVAIGEKPEQGFRPGFDAPLAHVSLDKPSLSLSLSRQEYWSGLPFLSPADRLDPGFEPRSPVLQADSLPSKPPGKPISL